MSAEEHERLARRATESGSIRVAIVTVSDTRGPREDRGGDAAAEIARGGGVTVVARRWVRDEPTEIEQTIESLLDDDLDALVLTGGTGLGPRDGTAGLVQRRLRIELPGFGEQVRALGMRDVGPASMLTRATGGVIESRSGRSSLIFAIPGSVRAVESVMRELLIPILPHAIWELRGRPRSEPG
jgi:molybdenum cofactor biosynthesis protein B